jgi:hypothetical protein
MAVPGAMARDLLLHRPDTLEHEHARYALDGLPLLDPL